METASRNKRTAARGGGQYAGKTATARVQERRKKLLQAGIALIGRAGYAVASVDAVCAEAGLTKRYFYESFSNREQLLTEAYQSATREMTGSIMQAAAPHLMDSRRLVRAGLEETFGFVHRNPDKARLIMIEAMSVRSQLGRVYGDGYEQFIGLLVGFTQPFLDGGGPGDKMLRVVAKGVIGAIIHACQGWIATDYRQPVGELVDGMEMILGGLGHQLGVRGWRGVEPLHQASTSDDST